MAVYPFPRRSTVSAFLSSIRRSVTAVSTGSPWTYVRHGSGTAGALMHYARQNHTDDLCFGAGAGFELRWLRVLLGYYCRVVKAGDGGSITEPLNLYYELAFSCLPDVEKWDLNAIISNYRPAQLERLHQPCIALEGIYYPSPCIGLVLSADYRRTGILHVSSSFYQFCGSLGVKYRW